MWTRITNNWGMICQDMEVVYIEASRIPAQWIFHDHFKNVHLNTEIECMACDNGNCEDWHSWGAEHSVEEIGNYLLIDRKYANLNRIKIIEYEDFSLVQKALCYLFKSRNKFPKNPLNSHYPNLNATDVVSV